MDVHEKMHNGDLYGPSEALVQEQAACLERQFEFNHTHPTDFARREALLREMFAEIGPGCYIEPPLHANWAGKFVHLGRSVYVNFNLTLVDDTAIYIGDYTMIGPNVTIATGTHPILPALRENFYQFNMPVRIGRNCWLGAGAIILPGVTIGDNVVVGPAASSPMTCPITSLRSAIPAACCARWGSATGKSISAVARSRPKSSPKSAKRRPNKLSPAERVCAKSAPKTSPNKQRQNNPRRWPCKAGSAGIWCFVMTRVKKRRECSGAQCAP